MEGKDSIPDDLWELKIPPAGEIESSVVGTPRAPKKLKGLKPFTAVCKYDPEPGDPISVGLTSARIENAIRAYAKHVWGPNSDFSFYLQDFVPGSKGEICAYFTYRLILLKVDEGYPSLTATNSFDVRFDIEGVEPRSREEGESPTMDITIKWNIDGGTNLPNRITKDK